MRGTDDQDDLVEFDARTRVDDGASLLVPPRKVESSVALDGQPEATRIAAPPVAAPDEDEPARTVMIDSPFAMPGGAPEIPPARLVVAEGNDRGKEFVLAGPAQVVGRGLDCGIVLNDPTVSRRHFQVEFTGGAWKLTDLGSGNGTKVDGQRMPGVDLVDGMRIEVGQTVLQFSGAVEAVAEGGDEESTRAVEIPVGLPVPGGTLLERPPRTDVPPRVEAAPVRPAPKAPPPPETVHPRPAPRIEVEDLPPDDDRGFPVWPVVGGGVVAVVIAVVVAQFGFGVRILPIGGEAPAPAVAVDETAGPKAEAADLQARAMKAIQDRQWDPAIAMLTSAKEKDPTLAGIDESVARARDEKRAGALLAAAKDSIEKGTPDAARGMLARVADSSVYYAEARQVLATLDGKHVEAEIEAIRAKVKEAKKGEARQLYVTLVTDHPEDPRVLGFRDELVAAGVALDPPAPRPAAAAAPREAPAREVPEPATAAPAREAPAAPSRPGKLDVPRALSAYDRGQFQQASADLRGAKAKGDDLAKAQALADRIDRFADAYNEGRTALAGKRLDRAEAGLSMALRLDQEVDGHYAPEIRGLLGDTYRGRAAAAIQNADYVLAARSARRALSYRAEDDMAKSILDKCLVMAQKTYDAAVADSKAGKKDEARQKARTVLDIVPKGHPLEEKAAALLR